MKRLAAIFLLCSLVLTILGYQAIFLLHLHEVRAEMKQYLVSHQLKEVEEFTFPVNSMAASSRLRWENDEEFSLDGIMYDVLQKKIEGNELIIRCVPDTKETALLQSFEQINKENNTPAKEKWASLIKLVTTCFEPVSSLCFSPPAAKHNTIFCAYSFTIPSPEATILTPPPQAS